MFLMTIHDLKLEKVSADKWFQRTAYRFRLYGSLSLTEAKANVMYEI